MDVGLEAREAFVEIAGILQVTDDGAVEALTRNQQGDSGRIRRCLLYTSDAADERSSVDLGGRRIIKKKNRND